MKILKKVKVNFLLNKSYLFLSDSSYLILVTCCFLLYACQKEVKIDMPTYSPKLVVNCFFNPDSTWKVNLSSSVPISGNDQPSYISNATVELYEDNVLISTLSYADSNYVNNQKPLLNKLYTLKVSAPGFESVECSDKLLSTTTTFTAKLDTIQRYITIKNLAFSENIPVSPLKIGIKDEATVENFYEFRGIYTNDQITPVRTTNVIFHSLSPGLESFSRYQRLVLFRDLLFNGKENDLMLYLDNQQTFFMTYLPSGDIGVLWWKINNLYFEMKQVSEQYFLYQKTFLQQKYNRENPFAEPTKVYTNVKNGLGIFAGYQSYKVKLL